MNGLEARVVVERGAFRLEADLEVTPGEILGVLGPNGAGKTTLLRALAGLTPLTGGRIEIGGNTVDDVAREVFVPPERRGVGVVFQDYRLFPHLRVDDNVAFAARTQGVRRAPARAAAVEVLDRLGLSGLAARRPHQLSGGQAQRVALARALAASPGLLLLDEPLSALDARTRLEVRSELQRHVGAFAGPTVMVTHDPLDALVLAGRLLVIEDGRVVQQGAAAEVARRPATDYVARLVGLNLLAGQASPDGIVALTGGGALQVPGGNPRGAVHLAISPSAVALHLERPSGSPRNVWPGVVRGVEMLADRVRVDVTADPPLLADVTPAAVAELGLTPGRQVWLAVKAAEIEAYPRADLPDGPTEPPESAPGGPDSPVR